MIIQKMKIKYNAYRQVRGDGNCYYRALGYSYLEHLIRITTPLEEITNLINKFYNGQGYYSIRDGSEIHQQLRQTFLNLLLKMKQLKEQGNLYVHQFLFQEIYQNKDSQDEALAWEMRTLTANYLEIHKEYFLNFCQIPFEQIVKDVLAMGKEAEGIGIGPLQVILNIKIEIVTIDRNYQDTLLFETFKVSGKLPVISILYKPGHYDIIYNKDLSKVDGFDEIQGQYNTQVLPFNYNFLQNYQPFYQDCILGKGEENSPKNETKILIQEVKQCYKKTWTPVNGMQNLMESQLFISDPQNLVQCKLCNVSFQQNQIIQLSCGHAFDKKCLLEKIERQTKGLFIHADGDDQEQATCPQCKTQSLTNEEIKQTIGKLKYQKAFEDADNRAVQFLNRSNIKKQQVGNKNQDLPQGKQVKNECYFKCIKENDQMVQLACQHKFCSSSIKNYLFRETDGNYIEMLNQVICPVDNCRSKLLASDFQIILGFEIYNRKYQEFIQRNKGVE